MIKIKKIPAPAFAGNGDNNLIMTQFNFNTKVRFCQVDFEKYFSKSGIKGRVQQAIAAETADTLKQFCTQETEFMQAVEQSDKSFQDCLDYVAEGVTSSISDFKAYSKAVEFYFPGAKIQFCMKIDLIGDAGNAPEQDAPKPHKITVSFNSSDFMDF